MNFRDNAFTRFAAGLAFNALKRPLLVRRENMRWRSASNGQGSSVRLYYGCERLPSSDEHASGGLVKCQDLERIFPNNPAAPTIMYLVSSALPPYAPLLADVCRRRGGKVVLNQNGVAYPGWYGKGWEKANKPMAQVHGIADHVFYQSGFCQRSARKFLGARGGQSEVLYNPVDTLVFTPHASARPVSEPVLLLAGSHHFRYRVTAAVDTLAALHESIPAARLLIAGRYAWMPDESASIEDLRTYVRAKGLWGSVDIEGSYTQQEAPGLYQRCHILLHTKYNDPCPRVVVEAMASGLPVVYSASGGVREQVGNEAGVGVESEEDWEQDHPPDVSDLTRAVLQVLQDHDGFSAAARKRAVERFSVEPWLKRHAEVFESLVQG